MHGVDHNESGSESKERQAQSVSCTACDDLVLHYTMSGICRASTQHGPAIRLLRLIVSVPQRRNDCHILLTLAGASGIEILPKTIFLFCSALGIKHYTSVIIVRCCDGTVLLWTKCTLLVCTDTNQTMCSSQPANSTVLPYASAT